MSVMIIGMNMPSSCYDCPLEKSVGCSVTGASLYWEETDGSGFKKKPRENFDPYSERLKNCPMIDMGRQVEKGRADTWRRA